jgi:DNA polymerase-3 subunit delta
MPATYEGIMSDLRKRIFKPVYFLAGDEPYYIDLITDYIAEKILTEEERAFNQIIIYGQDTTVNAIIE